jgi:putative ABC transport system ATP-binding protein
MMQSDNLTTPLICLESVSKNYSMGETTVQALRGVSLDIGSGEFVAVWGPSGSGKTTLLNLIGIIDEPTSGSVVIEGTDVAQLTDNRQSELRNLKIGFVFQNFNLVPVLSALENVLLPLQIQGIPRKDAVERSLHRLSQVGLKGFEAQRPDKLSGGQQQRVAIARALVTEPLLVIADEPTANLDSDTAARVVGLMRELNHKEQTTFIFSTHDQRLLGRVDRLIRLEDGRITGQENRR